MKTPAAASSWAAAYSPGSELMQLRLLRGVRPASDAGSNGSRGRGRGSLAARRCRLRTLARLKRQLPRLCASVQLHCCSAVVCRPDERMRAAAAGGAAATVWGPYSSASQPLWQHQQPPVVCMATVATHFGFLVATCRAGQADRPACRAAVQLPTYAMELCQRLALALDDLPPMATTAGTAAAAVASVTTCCLFKAAVLLGTLDLAELATKASCTTHDAASASFAGSTDEEGEADERLLELLSRPSQQQQRQQQRQRRQRRSRRLPMRRRVRLLPDASDSWDLLAASSTDGVSISSSSCAPPSVRHQPPAAFATPSTAPTDATATTMAGNAEYENEEEEEEDGDASCSGDSAFFTCSVGRPRRQQQLQGDATEEGSSSGSCGGDGGEFVHAEKADALNGLDDDNDNKDSSFRKDEAAVAALWPEDRRSRRLRRRCLGLTWRLRAALLEAAPPPATAATRVRDLLGQALATLSSSAATATDCAVSVDTLCCIDLDAAAAAAEITAANGGDCGCGSSAAGLSKKPPRSQGSHRHRRHRRWQLGAMKNGAPDEQGS